MVSGSFQRLTLANDGSSIVDLYIFWRPYGPNQSLGVCLHAWARQTNSGWSANLSSAATVATWDVYDKGFWGARGLGTIADYGELEEMRTQPTDIHVHDTNEFTDNFGWSDDGIVPTQQRGLIGSYTNQVNR